MNNRRREPVIRILSTKSKSLYTNQSLNYKTQIISTFESVEAREKANFRLRKIDGYLSLSIQTKVKSAPRINLINQTGILGLEKFSPFNGLARAQREFH